LISEEEELEEEISSKECKEFNQEFS